MKKMATSRDNVETFLEEFREEIIADVRSPEAIIEAWISQQPTTIIESLTTQEQMRELFHVVQKGTSQSKVVFYQILSQKDPKLIADLEQRRHNSKMTQTEQKWTEEQWKETQTNREENLKTKTAQQQEDIGRQTAEKHEQDLFLKRLRSQVESVIENLEESKNEATQEKMNLLKMWAEIHQERETLDRRSKEIIKERHKLEMMKFNKTKLEESKESQDSMEQKKEEQDIMEKLMAGGLLSVVNRKNKIMLEAKQAKEEIEKNIADIKQELKRNKMAISQHRGQVEQIKYNMNVMKQMWTNIQRGLQMQKAAVTEMDSMKTQWETEMADIQRQKKDFEKNLAQVHSERDEIERIKNKIQLERENTVKDRQLAKAEMDAMRDSTERQKQEVDNLLQMTKKEMRELDVLNTEIEIKKKHLLKMIRMSRGNKEQITECARQGLEERQDKTEDQRSEQELQGNAEDRSDEEGDMDMSTKTRINTDIQKVILQVEEIRKMLRIVRDDAEQRSRDFTEEKSQIKWMNFQAKKKRRMLEQWLEKTIKERDELEILKVKIKHQREEFEHKLKDARTIIGKITTNIQKVSEKTNHTREEILKIQREMENNKEKVKKYMDKLASMKTQVNRWIVTESEIKRIVSANVSEYQEIPRETFRESLKYQTLQIPTGERDEYAKEAMSLEQSVTLGAKHQCEEITEQEYRQSEYKKSTNTFLSMQTEVCEEIDNDQTELIMHVREKEEIEKQISKLKAKDEKIKEEIKDAMKNMEENSQEIERLIMEINDLQVQRLEVETGIQITVREPGSVYKEETRLGKEREHTDIWRVDTNIYKHEIMNEVQDQRQENDKVKQEVIDESDMMRLDVEKQKQRQDSKEVLKENTEELDEGCDKKDTGSSDRQRLRAEIYKTQEIIRSLKVELENQNEKCRIEKNHKSEDGEIEGLLQELKEFQDILKMEATVMRKSEMYLKKEMRNMKSMKIATKKQKRELEKRLEKTLRERDELDIIKTKMLRRTEAIVQKLEKMAKVKTTVEKMAAKTRNKSEDIKLIIKETKVKVRQIEDLVSKTDELKPNLDESYFLISQEMDDLAKFKDQVNKKKHGESVLQYTEREKGDIKKHIEETEIFRLKPKSSDIEEETISMSESVKKKTEKEEIKMLKEQIQLEKEKARRAKQQAEEEIHNIKCLRENIEREKQELDDRAQMIKRETREMELLKSELDIKRRESKKTFRKTVRKIEESEMMWNEIQREKQSFRSETKKKRKELDQRLEKTMRERDELEVLRMKLQHRKKELTEKKQDIKGCKEHEVGSLENNQSNKDKMITSSNFTDLVIDLQQLTKKIKGHLEIIRKEIRMLVDVNIHLRKQLEMLQKIRDENRTVRHNMSRIKSELKKKVNIQAENAVIIQIRDSIQKQQMDLVVTLEKVKQERREIEVLKLETEIQKRKNQQMIQKRIRKDRELKNLLAEIKGERESLKRKTQKRKKELDQKLERIIRERDELEIVKLKLQRERDERGSGMEVLSTSDTTNVPHQIQLHRKLSLAFIEKYKYLETHSNGLKMAMRDEYQHIKGQEKILTQTKAEVESMKKQIRRNIEIMKNNFKNIQQKKITLGKEFKKMRKVLKEGRDNLEKEKVIKLTFGRKMTNIRERINSLEQDMPKEKEKIKKTKIDKQMMIDHLHLLLTKIKSEKTSIQVLTVQVQTARCKIRNVIDKIVLTQEKQQLKQDDINRQTEELQSIQHNLMTEREELELLRRDLNNKKQEVDNAIRNTEIEKEQLSQMKSDIDLERNVLLNERNVLKVERSDLKIKEDQLLEREKFLEILRVKFQRLNKKIIDNTNNKFTTLEEKSEVVVALVKDLKHMYKSLDDQKEYSTSYSEILQIEKKGLIRMLKMIIHEEEIQNKLEQQLLVEKQDLETLKNGLKEDIGNLERQKNVINKEKVDFEQMSSNIQDQMQSLEKDLREEMDKLKITKSDLQRTKEHIDLLLTEIKREKTNIQGLTPHIHTAKCKLVNVMNMIVLTQEEQQLKQDDINRQTLELQISQQTSMTEREELQLLRRDLNTKKQEVEDALKNIKEERDHLSQMKSDIDRERAVLLNEQDVLKAERSNLKIKDNQLLEREKFLEILRVKFQRLNEKIIDNIKNKFTTLEQHNEDVVTLVNDLEQKHKSLDDQKEDICSYSEILQNEKKGLTHMLRMIIHKEAIQTQLGQQLLLEKQDLETLKEGLKEDTGNLKRQKRIINKEKLDFEEMTSNIQDQVHSLEEDLREKMDKLEITNSGLEITKVHLNLMITKIKKEKINIQSLAFHGKTVQRKLMNVINMIVLEQDKQDDIIRQTQDLTSCQQTLRTHQEKLEHLRRDLRNKKQEVEDAIKNIKQERDQLSQIKSEIDIERDMLLNERDGFKAKGSDLKMRVDHLLEKEKYLEILRVKLQQLNESIFDNIYNKFTTLEQQSESVVSLVTDLEQKHESLSDQKERITALSEMLQNEKEGLTGMLKIILNKKAIQNQLEQQLLMEKQDLETLKEKLKEGTGRLETEKHVINRHKNLFNKEKLDFGQMTSNIQDQMQSLEKDLREEMDNLKITKSDLQMTKDHVDPLLNELNIEKTNIQGLILKVYTARHKLVNIKNMIVLNLKHFDWEENIFQSNIKFEDQRKISKSLRTIWMDMVMVRREINQMKSKGHDMRNKLEKRLKIINQFVRRTWMQKEKQQLGKTKTIQRLHMDTSTSHQESHLKTLDEKCKELQKLKDYMLLEIETLQIKDNISKILTTNEKAIQTLSFDTTTDWDETMQITPQTSTKTYHRQMKTEETKATQETNTGLLHRLWHYCCRCCRLCCTCCKQVCSEET